MLVNPVEQVPFTLELTNSAKSEEHVPFLLSEEIALAIHSGMVKTANFAHRVNWESDGTK